MHDLLNNNLQYILFLSAQLSMETCTACVEVQNYQHPFYLTGKQYNVLLDANNTARLTDFGFASLIGDIPEALTYLQWSSMQHGAVRWAAPEQVLSEQILDRTTKSDIWSFGCISLQESLLNMTSGPFLILSQVLSGKRPWSEVQGDICIGLLLTQGQKPRRPESLAIANQHWDLIQQCWSSVQDRPPADSIITSIEAFLIDSQFSTAPSSPMLASTPPAGHEGRPRFRFLCPLLIEAPH